MRASGRDARAGAHRDMRARAPSRGDPCIGGNTSDTRGGVDVYCAIIADIVGSRRLTDRHAVQATFADALTRAAAGLALPQSPIATVGDEFQAIAASLPAALTLTVRVQLLLPEGLALRFGIGVGRVETVSADADGAGAATLRQGTPGAANPGNRSRDRGARRRRDSPRPRTTGTCGRRCRGRHRRPGGVERLGDARAQRVGRGGVTHRARRRLWDLCRASCPRRHVGGAGVRRGGPNRCGAG